MQVCESKKHFLNQNTSVKNKLGSAGAKQFTELTVASHLKRLTLDYDDFYYSFYKKMSREATSVNNFLPFFLQLMWYFLNISDANHVTS